MLLLYLKLFEFWYFSFNLNEKNNKNVNLLLKLRISYLNIIFVKTCLYKYGNMCLNIFLSMILFLCKYKY